MPLSKFLRGWTTLYGHQTPLKIHSAHKNLLFVFPPVTLRPNAPRYFFAKLHRWTIHRSRFRLIIENIEGVTSVFANWLTRWSQSNRTREAVRGNFALLCQSSPPESTKLKEITMKKYRTLKDGITPRGTLFETLKGYGS